MSPKEFVKFMIKSLDEHPDDWEIKQYTNSTKRILIHKGDIVIDIDGPDVLIGNASLKNVSVSIPLSLSRWQKRRVFSARDACLREKAARMIDRSYLQEK